MVHFFIVSALTKLSIWDITFKKIMNETLIECLIHIYSFIYNNIGLDSHCISENLHLIIVVHICYSRIPSKNLKQSRCIIKSLHHSNQYFVSWYTSSRLYIIVTLLLLWRPPFNPSRTFAQKIILICWKHLYHTI